MLHEIWHAMGFSAGSWEPGDNMLLDEDLNPRGTIWEEEWPFPAYRQTPNGPPPAGGTFSRMFLDPPRALIAARRFFGCGTLERLEIEDEGGSGSRGSHWEQRTFLQSTISASVSDTSEMMEVTLAFFEDTGWYRANLSRAGLPQYGFQQGCVFASSTECGTSGWGAAGSGVAPGLSLPAAYWPSWQNGGTVMPAEGLDTVCSYDRMGISNNHFTWENGASRCNGDATHASQFDENCGFPPWQTHFPTNSSTGRFLYHLLSILSGCASSENERARHHNPFFLY